MKSILRNGGLSLLALAALMGAYLLGIQLTGNFATVVAGEVYRSNQPTPARLEVYEKAHGIRSIINLRGDSNGEDWYQQELASAKKLSIAHYDFAMSDREELSADRAKQLVALMEKAEKPLLIHCKAGADRTGLASALYLAKYAGSSEQDAEAQLSIRYGHISLSLSPSNAMDRTFEKLEHWLGYSNPKRNDGLG